MHDASVGTVMVSPYAAEDRERVIGLVLHIQQVEFGVPITLADQPDLADVPASYQCGRGGFWAAKVGECVVGVVGLLDAGGEVALRKMFVHRDYRGPGYRVAAQLLETLLAHARAKAVPRVLLGTRPEMRAAHRFYEKNGFMRVEAGELPPSFPRMAVDSVFYRLDLGARRRDGFDGNS